MTETNLITKDNVGNYAAMSKLMGVDGSTEDSETKTSILALKANLATYKINFLNPAGSGYINSRHNHTN